MSFAQCHSRISFEDDCWRRPASFVHIVTGEKNLKAFALDQREQRAVFDAAPFHADDRFNFMLRQEPYQLVWYVLVKQNLQGCACN